MVDRDLMEMQGWEGVYNRDESVETVIGAGHVGVITASYKERQCRVLVARIEPGLVRGGPDAMPVSRGEAALGMQRLEQRAAQAIAGTAVQTTQAMDRLAGQAATAVQQTAKSSHKAVSHLEGQTCEAFGRTEIALGSMHEDLVSNAEKLTNLEHTLAYERQQHAQAEERMRQDQQATVADL